MAVQRRVGPWARLSRWTLCLQWTLCLHGGGAPPGRAFRRVVQPGARSAKYFEISLRVFTRSIIRAKGDAMSLSILRITSVRRSVRNDEYLSPQGKPSNEQRTAEKNLVGWKYWCCLAKAEPLKPTWQQCESLFLKAIRSSRRQGRYSVKKWVAAKQACKLCNIDFESAVNTKLATGQTPLQHLASSHDHKALHFVHTYISPGDYAGNIHFGKAYELGYAPFKGTWTVPGATSEFGYYGQLNDLRDLEGYGVLRWKNGITYVGKWATSWEVFTNPARLKNRAVLREPHYPDLGFSYGRYWSDIEAEPIPT